MFIFLCILEKIFSMSKKDCQESLRIYKAFLKRMDHVNHFIQEAVTCDLLQLQDGFGKRSLIFKPVSNSVLDALEDHLVHLEGKNPTNRRRTASPTLSSPPTTTAVPGDLVLLQDLSNDQNLSTEQQCITGRNDSVCKLSTTTSTVSASIEALVDFCTHQSQQTLSSPNPSDWTTIATISDGSSLAQKSPTTTAASDLHSRLAAIAGQLSVTNTSTMTGSASVNWTGVSRPKQQQSTGEANGSMAASAVSP
ncbi:unnamed protein product [Taenia asiatica]|uniref:ANTH domain-containing protein n=1 Tax=Taenia asiatica TaxID=60517 RepID=A0A0R3VWE2_TAEAS|nr:unnamed protein product [Taenia asiatica]